MVSQMKYSPKLLMYLFCLFRDMNMKALLTTLRIELSVLNIVMI